MPAPLVLPLLVLLLTTLPAGPPDPRFEAQTVDDQVQIGYGLAIGDVDGDGAPDILLADKQQFVWYRNGDWKRFVMVDSLTERDNVALTARDLDGDGRVEVAVGARWNPGETADADQSGSVHYLIRPDDPTQPWTPVRLYHEPTVHRMHWVRVAPDRYNLVVLPLHGIGNENGEGAGVRALAYAPPADPTATWTTTVVDDQMHMTHNFDVVPDTTGGPERLWIAGREGLRTVAARDGTFDAGRATWLVRSDQGTGEVRHGTLAPGRPFAATIEPMHGTDLAVYRLDTPSPQRLLLDDSFEQGHALATADLLGLGRDQIVAGWRAPNADEKVGVKLYVPDSAEGASWTPYVIDDNGMACEDVKVADLDGDGRLDIVAAGRDTHNLKIYWNRTDGVQ